MAFDGLFLHGLTAEIHSALIQAQIDKIYMPASHELVFHFRNKLQLYISIQSAHPAVYLTKERYENPLAPPMLCMLLRKYLTGARLVGIQQMGLDRVLKLHFEAHNDFGDKVIRTLIVEIMGKHSNAILIDGETQVIIDALKRVSPLMSVREIYPGLIYKPMISDKVNLLESDVQLILTHAETSELPLDKWLIHTFEGMSPAVSKTLCRKAQLNPKAYVNQLDSQAIQDLEACLTALQSQLISNQYNPRLYQLEKAYDYHILDLLFQEPPTSIQFFPSISSLVAHYGTLNYQSNRVQQKGQDLMKRLNTRLEKAYIKINHLLSDYEHAEASELYQLYGELITANLYQAKKTMNQMKVINYYTNEEVVIPLDVRLTPMENAQHYYKRYQKSKNAKLEIKRQLSETEDEIKYLEQVLTLLENAQDYYSIELIADEMASVGYIRKTYTKKQPKKPSFKPMLFKSTTGQVILVGRNNLQNDQLTLKESKRTDLWLHTKNIPGSHVVVRTEGGSVDDQTLLEAAVLAATFSKGKNTTRVAVDYTEVKNVKKPSGAKPGMVIYDHYKTVIVDPNPALIEALKASL